LGGLGTRGGTEKGGGERRQERALGPPGNRIWRGDAGGGGELGGEGGDGEFWCGRAGRKMERLAWRRESEDLALTSGARSGFVD
jgi:hypothetical protein